MNLTNVQIKNTQPKDKSFKLSDGRGLYLLVNPNGTKYWRVKYRYNGKEKLLALGVYPQISLLEARKKCEEAKEMLSQWFNPNEERKTSKYDLVCDQGNIFEAIANEWIQNKCKTWSDSHYKKVIQSLEANVFPYIGNKNINGIEPLEMLSIFQKIEDREAFEITRKTRQRCGEVFKYAIITGRCRYNPCADLSGALQKHQVNHYPHLLEKDFPPFIKALTQHTEHSPIIGRAAKLLMIAGVRIGELRLAQWCEIDFDRAIWEIPAERMKKRKPHIVPLSSQAIDILKYIYQFNGQYFNRCCDMSTPIFCGALNSFTKKATLFLK